MAKVTGPLFSITASGKFGPIVFDKRGYARIKVTPHNPQTAAQGNHRQAMKAAHQGVSILSEETREALKTNQLLKKSIGNSFKASYWSGYFVKQLLGHKKTTYYANIELFNNFSPIAQQSWEQAAITQGLSIADIDYASDAGITPGQQLFLVANALYSLNLYTHHQKPNPYNAQQWATSVSGDILTTATTSLVNPPSTQALTQPKTTTLSNKTPISPPIQTPLPLIAQIICLYFILKYHLIKTPSYHLPFTIYHLPSTNHQPPTTIHHPPSAIPN